MINPDATHQDMLRNARPRTITDDLVIALHKHHRHQLELEAAGYGVYSQTALHDQTAELLKRARGQS